MRPMHRMQNQTKGGLDNTDEAVTKATDKMGKGKSTEQSRSMKQQDKTGAYKEKRKPGDYLK